MKDLYTKLSHLSDMVIYVTGSLGILLTVGCSAYNIVSMWTVGRRSPHLDELSLFSLVWIIYIGIGLLYKRKEHVTMDFVVNLLPGVWRAISRIVNDLVIIAISAITCWFAWKLSIKSFDKLLMITKIPYFYCDIVVFIGYGHLTILAIIDAAVNLAGLVQKKGGPVELWRK